MKIISLMIRVNPKDRPSCEELLKNPEVSNRIKAMKLSPSKGSHRDSFHYERKSILLQTIKVPKDLKRLGKDLPKA